MMRVQSSVRGILSRPDGWTVHALCVAFAVVLPLAMIAAIGFKAGMTGAVIDIPLSILGPSLLETLVLLSGVAALSALLGVTTAWLVVQFEFPGRKWISFALVLPFAVPTYIAAYCWVEAMDYFGPIQSGLRTLMGYTRRTDYWFPDVRSMTGAILVTSAVLYPYVYLATRAALSMRGASLDEAARSLGCGRVEAFGRAVLPALWPALAVGLTLVLLETLNDIGATQYLGIRTLTVSIYDLWLSRNSLTGAAQMAILLLLLVVLVQGVERMVRMHPRFRRTARVERPAVRQRLRGWTAGAALCICALPILLGFGVPIFVLASAQWHQGSALIDPGLWSALGYTVLVAVVATLLILIAAVLIALGQRVSRHPAMPIAARLSGLGYVLPGTVLVLGLLPLLGLMDQALNLTSQGLGGPRLGLVLSASLLSIILAYIIRFLTLGLEQAHSALGTLSPHTESAARLLGASRRDVAWIILFPAIRPVLAGAAILIFVDCLKELPATLLLRPLNVETLSTWLYGYATRGSFEDGASAALLIVLAGLVPLILLDRLIDRGALARSGSGE